MIVVDGHAHIYPHFPLNKAFAEAFHNLTELVPEDSIPVIFLADPKGVKVFDALKKLADQRVAFTQAPGWFVRSTLESVSVVLNGPRQETLVVIQGQQLVSSEGIEVLAIGSKEKVSDGQPIKSVLELAKMTRTFLILPWGLGKWFGGRGQVIDDIMEEYNSVEISLGDNSARPCFWSETRFKVASQRGMRVLAGSDPLPLEGAESHLGSFGFAINRELDLSAPWRQLNNLLRDLSVDVKTVGRQMRLGQNFINQVALRLRGRS